METTEAVPYSTQPRVFFSFLRNAAVNILIHTALPTSLNTPWGKSLEAELLIETECSRFNPWCVFPDCLLEKLSHFIIPLSVHEISFSYITAISTIFFWQPFIVLICTFLISVKFFLYVYGSLMCFEEGLFPIFYLSLFIVFKGYSLNIFLFDFSFWFSFFAKKLVLISISIFFVFYLSFYTPQFLYTCICSQFLWFQFLHLLL